MPTTLRTAKYNQDTADRFCEMIATSTRGITAICKELGVTRQTVYKWLTDDEHTAFQRQYARARELQADALMEEIISIADDASNDVIAGATGDKGNTAAISRAKLRVDARKWAAARLAPKKYGDTAEHTGDADIVITGMCII